MTSSKQDYLPKEQFLIEKGTIQFCFINNSGKNKTKQKTPFFSNCSRTGFQTLPQAPKTEKEYF